MGYQPSGGTALYDALGCVLQAYQHEEDNIVVIITDGEDNRSRNFGAARVKTLVDDLTKNKGWEFSYLGANQNPLVVSRQLGIATANTKSFDFSNQGFKDMYSNLNKKVQSFRVQQYSNRMQKQQIG